MASDQKKMHVHCKGDGDDEGHSGNAGPVTLTGKKPKLDAIEIKLSSATRAKQRPKVSNFSVNC